MAEGGNDPGAGSASGSGGAGPQVYLAAERTMLAWLRTGLGLMAAGFAVARFALFLREMQGAGTHAVTGFRSTTGLSLWAGVALVALGVVVNVGAAVAHVRLVRQLRDATWQPRISGRAVALALVLAAIGVGMAIYLPLTR